MLELFSSGEQREQDEGERYRPQEVSMDREELDREELDREVLAREALLANECPRRISSQRFA